MAYSSEAAKVRDMPNLMKYITGTVADVGAGHDKITPDAIAFDGRALPGVDVVTESQGITLDNTWYHTVFSSHFLEHVPDPFSYLEDWYEHLIFGGHLVLYMPDKDHYNNHDNPEHCFNWSYEDFLFFFKRTCCGEGKNFRGEHNFKMFEIVDSGMDVGEDRYSFYIIARKV